MTNSKPCILLLEHVASEREYLTQILSEKFTVYVAENGQMALELYTLNYANIQLIITGLFFGTFSTVDFINRLKHESFLPQIIVLSSSHNPNALIEVMVAGAYDVLQKPFLKEELMVMIEKSLDQTILFEQFVKRVEQSELGLVMRTKWLDLNESGFQSADVHSSLKLANIFRDPIQLAQDLGVSLAWEKKPKLLIVEDESVVQDVLVQMLRMSFSVLAVDTAADALDRLREHPDIQLVLLDIGLPDMMGNEALVTIKQEFSNIEVMMLTAYTEVDLVVECIRNGASDYISKPFEETHLLAKVSQVLTKKIIKQAMGASAPSSLC
jgi:DNA-binding response OmpR family regulator